MLFICFSRFLRQCFGDAVGSRYFDTYFYGTEEEIAEMTKNIGEEIQTRILDCAKETKLKFKKLQIEQSKNPREWYPDGGYGPCYSRNQNVIRSLLLLRFKCPLFQMLPKDVFMMIKTKAILSDAWSVVNKFIESREARAISKLLSKVFEKFLLGKFYFALLGFEQGMGVKGEGICRSFG